MNIFETTTFAVMKRPFIIIMIGILMFLAAVVNAFVPVIAMIMGIINITGGGIFEGILSILQMLIEPGAIITGLEILAVFALFAAIAAGLLLPGYLLVVGDSVEQGRGKQGLFLFGLKTFLFKVFLMTIKAVLSAAFLAVFLMVAGVPAIVVTKAALTTRPNLMIAAVFVDIVTVGVLFLSLSFFKAYVFMWFLAAVNGLAKPFRTGKSIADRSFWKLALGMLSFDVVFAVVIFTIYLSNNQLFRYVAGWVFASGFFTVFAVYLVQFFREGSKRTGKAIHGMNSSDHNGEASGKMEGSV
jgi:hypothetical protein